MEKTLSGRVVKKFSIKPIGAIDPIKFHYPTRCGKANPGLNMDCSGTFTMEQVNRLIDFFTEVKTTYEEEEENKKINAMWNEHIKEVGKDGA